MERKLIAEKSFIIKVNEYDDGTIGMSKTINGFKLPELIGLLDVIHISYRIDFINNMIDGEEQTELNK